MTMSGRKSKPDFPGAMSIERAYDNDELPPPEASTDTKTDGWSLEGWKARTVVYGAIALIFLAGVAAGFIGARS